MQRLRWLQRGERRLPFEALIALPTVALGLRIKGLRRVQAALDRRPTAAAPVARDTLATARRIAWCVYAAAAHGPWQANCLQRSVVTLWFLRRRRIMAELRIGVRRGTDGNLDFHAWVEHAGEVINDQPDVRQRYATFDRAIVPTGDARWDT